jgi:hypothetical protein
LPNFAGKKRAKSRKYVQILKIVTIACALHVLHIVAHPTSNKKYFKKLEDV